MADFNKLKNMWQQKSTTIKPTEPQEPIKPKKQPGKLNLDSYNTDHAVINPTKSPTWIKEQKPESPIVQIKAVENQSVSTNPQNQRNQISEEDHKNVNQLKNQLQGMLKIGLMPSPVSQNRVSHQTEVVHQFSQKRDPLTIKPVEGRETMPTFKEKQRMMADMYEERVRKYSKSPNPQIREKSPRQNPIYPEQSHQLDIQKQHQASIPRKFTSSQVKPEPNSAEERAKYLMDQLFGSVIPDQIHHESNPHLSLEIRDQKNKPRQKGFNEQ